MLISDWSSDVCSSDLLGFDFIADLELLARVLDTLVGDVAGGQVAFDAVAEIDGRATGVDFLDRALDDRTTGVVRLELAHRVLLKQIGRAACRARVCR